MRCTTPQGAVLRVKQPNSFHFSDYLMKQCFEIFEDIIEATKRVFSWV